MKRITYFTAGADIVRRAGIIASRYRTKDGRFIITSDDLWKLSLVMTPMEYVTGLDIIEVSETESKRLIAENGYQMGEDYAEPEPEPEEQVLDNEETVENVEESSSSEEQPDEVPSEEAGPSSEESSSSEEEEQDNEEEA